MLTLHPNILERDGEKAFVVLPYEEFRSIQEELSEYDDIRELRAAKANESDSHTTPLRSVRNELNI
jgi:PHD/YefM family antitoxin component YafN of YafNO toxin-antitoxin module